MCTLQVPSSTDLSQTMNTLIPFWDMANHDNGELSTDFDDENQSTLCMAHTDFQPGQQFTIFYGVRANIDLLVHNGFVFDANNSDCLTLRLGISKNDPLAVDKFAFLEELAIPRTGHFFLNRLPEKPIDNTLLFFLRVLCLNKDEIATFKEAPEKVKADLGNEVSSTPELDKRVFRYMETRCTLLMRSYPTSLEDDLELLKKEEISQKQYFCYLLRSKEKEMLIDAIVYCKSKQ
jgi:histone-lysine N-methyltransferase SETD3